MSSPEQSLSPVDSSLEELSTNQAYYQQQLQDGYKGLLGAILGTLMAELILWVGHVYAEVPLVFLAIGGVLALRHLAQIWQAKQQLKQLSSGT